MLTIRLTRKGKKNQPFFRVVLIDKRRSSTGGRAVEDLGYVDPLKKRKNLKTDRIKYWLSKGAQPSDTLHNMFVNEELIEGKKVHVSKLSKKAKEEITKKTEESAAKAAKEAIQAPAEQPVAEQPAETVTEAPKEEKPAETA